MTPNFTQLQELAFSFAGGSLDRSGGLFTVEGGKFHHGIRGFEIPVNM
jgi:hypothetical protein